MFAIPGGVGQLDDVFYGESLTDTAKDVYMALMWAGNVRDDGTFSLEEVRERAGCTMREFERAIMELRGHFLIGFDEVCHGMAIGHKFCFADEVEELDDGDDVPAAPWGVNYSAFSLKQGWAMLDAPPLVKLVLAYLHARIGTTGIRMPIPQGEIAEYTGLSKKTVSRALKWLVNNNIIFKWENYSGDGLRGVCEYAIVQFGVLIPDWVPPSG
jgi:hypothetical protein